MLSTVIGSYPKPDYLKITDWFNAQDGTDTAHPTMLYNTEIKKLGKQAEKIFQQACRKYASDTISFIDVISSDSLKLAFGFELEVLKDDADSTR